MTAARTQWLSSARTPAAAMRTSPAVMAAQPSPSPRAVLLDALGTLVRFEPPAPLLRAALEERFGVDVGEAAARAAIAAEIAFYRAHLHEGRDLASLADLRARSAAAMRPALPGPVAAAKGERLTEALMAALRFRAFPEVPEVLRTLRERGLALVVVSNWDASLHERLEETGLAGLVDGALASAEAGVAKPGEGIFRAALAIAGVDPGEAWHVGDSLDADVGGALAAGLRAVLVAREGASGAVPAGVPVLPSLAGLPELVARAAYPPLPGR
jgi:putative hydrolase of the HAD superfamily